MAEKNGGPAFPSYQVNTSPYGPVYSMYDGMTLRDWFAGMAMQGLLSGKHPYIPTDRAGTICWEAYALADAMLKAREEQPNG